MTERRDGWQPIKTAPKDGSRIDLWLSSKDGVEQWREPACWWNADRKLWANHRGMWDCATRWMPIPKGPDEPADSHAPSPEGALDRLLNVARGCHDYGGGYKDPVSAEIYHHGIATVISALEAAAKNDPSDGQVNALERIDAATGAPSAELDCANENLTDLQIKYMRDRFLNWTLPKDLNPDGGISFQRSETALKYNHPWPVGTNFLTAEQAGEMVRHMVDGMPLHEIAATGAPGEAAPTRTNDPGMEADFARTMADFEVDS